MKNLLFICFVLSSFCSSAQIFTRVDTVQVIDDIVPLRNPWAGGLNYPMVGQIDLNGDHKLDLLLYEPAFDPGHYRLIPLLNVGDSGQADYLYAPQYISRFPYIYAWMVLADYNCDGKMDLFCFSYKCNCGMTLYRNDYTDTGGLKFTVIQDPIMATYLNSQYLNIPCTYLTVPNILDVDGDGDVDIVGWIVGTTNLLNYFHGTSVDNGWSCDSLRFREVAGCWGHFMFNSGTNSATLGINCRQMEPDSALYWDTGITMHDDTQSCICLYDQDGDGYKDALAGGAGDKNVLYLHNGGTFFNDSMNYQDKYWPRYASIDTPKVFRCSYNLDADNDGKKDMIIVPHSENDYRGIQFYKDTNLPGDTPIFMRRQQGFLQREMIDVGTTSAPQIFDYDCDGLPDLLVGDVSYLDTTGIFNKGIALYKNIGTASAPKFKLITRDFADINVLNGFDGPFCPTFGDVDGDGDPDMIVGRDDGKLYLFQNTAGVCSPANFLPPTGNYMGIDVGSNSVPQLYDLDGDGHLDLIVGNKGGIIKYYRNTSTDSTFAFSSQPTQDSLGGINVRPPLYTYGYASPVFYKYNGMDKMLVGTFGGKLYMYDNITGNINGKYHLADSLFNWEEGGNLIPSISDINNDGHPDLLLGNSDGGVSLFMGDLPNSVNEFQKEVLSTFDAYPNPVTDELHLNFYHLENTPAYFEIINAIGQMMYRARVTDNKMTVSMKNLSSGIFLARFVSADHAQSIKIVVRH